MSTAPWLTEAHKDLGLRELVAGDLNPEVRAYFKHTRFPPEMITKKTAWCAAAICAWLERAGYRSPRTARASGFARYGTAVELQRAQRGDIVVFGKADPDAGGSGHVALLWHPQSASEWQVLGGNQGNRVCIALRPVARVVAVRRPPAPEALGA
jgi:uncharacterized protein (TIGR02594 family)